jgi:hypothetical protein
LGDSLDAKSSLEEMNLEELFGIELEKDPLPTPTQAPPIIQRKKKPISDDVAKTKTMDKPGPVGKAKSPKSKSASPPKPPKKALIKPVPKSKPSTTSSKARNSKSEIQKDTKKPKKELNDKSKIKQKPINRLKKSEK